MSGKSIRLLPLFVVVALVLADRRAAAQFVGAGGVIGPRAFPSPFLNYGGYGGYGGYGTQWMQNPYAGYLNGAANVTTANGQYQISIQQARILREESRRSALQTRRATLEEREYERSLLPDPEKIRQEQMMKSLNRSRHNPPAIDIWSATALNDLLRAIQTAETRGGLSADVELPPDVLKHLNVTSGTTYGGVGLLRDGGKQNWPATLREATFDAERGRLDRVLPQAVKEASSGSVSAKTLKDVRAALKDLERVIDARASDLTTSEFIEASRYLRELKEANRVLQQSDVARYFRSNWTPQGSTVSDLVKQMTQQGLRFAPAVSGDEPYYTSLYRSLVDYDQGLTPVSMSAQTP